jgi:CheY-like chemotaxis protein
MTWLKQELAQARSLVHQLTTLNDSAPPEIVDQLVQALDRIEAGCHEMAVRVEESTAFAEDLEVVQERLQQKHAAYQELFSRAPVGCLLVGPGGRVRQANRLAARLLASPSLEPGSLDLTRLEPGLAPLADLAQAAASGHPQACRLHAGPEGRVLAYCAPVEGPEGERLVLAVLLDLARLPAMELPGDRNWSQELGAQAENVLGRPAGLHLVAAGGQGQRTLRVLLAEDEEGMRELCSRKLRSMGFEVTACGDGREALDRFLEQETPYDLVITDQNMPRLNGDRLVRSIREEGSQVPVLLYTGYLDQYTGQEVATCGADRVLQKPLPLADFQAVVQSLLKGPARPEKAGGEDAA